MDTVRLDLGDGDYAVLFPQMMHRTTRAIRAAFPDYKPTNGDMPPAPMIDRSNEIILLNQVFEWSFGTVSQETIDTMVSAKYDILIQGVDRLYGQAPLPVKAASV